jgi:type II restriction enzyme
MAQTITASRDPGSDVVSESLLAAFGDTLVVHHLNSAEPFTKDRFEHALVELFLAEGRDANLSPRGNPGEDVTVDGERWSVKTQADRGISPDVIHISKFMELGKGKWVTVDDLPGLRDQMLAHMESYERIFTLRCLSMNPRHTGARWEYELVEIPKALLQRADGRFRMDDDSRQNPKPGHYTVVDGGLVLLDLYFDGGTERKLQIVNLRKALCRVHATWSWTPEAP